MATRVEERIEECKACGKPFEVRLLDPGGPFLDRESIDCPYCGVECDAIVTAGAIHTYKLTPEEAAKWRARTPRTS